MNQELYDMWTEIQKRYGEKGNLTVEEVQERLSQELNLLEAFRLVGCTRVPGEKFDVQSLISDRHKRLQEVITRLKGKH